MSWRRGAQPARNGHGSTGGDGGMRHGGHGWMMLACCVPMLLIAVALVAAHVVGAGFLLAAVACTAAMAVMMRGTGHGGRPPGNSE